MADGRAPREDNPLDGVGGSAAPADERGYLRERADAAEQPAVDGRRSRRSLRDLTVHISAATGDAKAALRRLEQSFTPDEIRELATAFDAADEQGALPPGFDLPADADAWLRQLRTQYLGQWNRALADGDYDFANAARRNFRRERDDYLAAKASGAVIFSPAAAPAPNYIVNTAASATSSVWPLLGGPVGPLASAASASTSMFSTFGSNDRFGSFTGWIASTGSNRSDASDALRYGIAAASEAAAAAQYQATLDGLAERIRADLPAVPQDELVQMDEETFDQLAEAIRRTRTTRPTVAPSEPAAPPEGDGGERGDLPG